MHPPANAEELAVLLTQEQGKPLEESRGELGIASAFARHLSSLELKPKTIVDDDEKYVVLTRRPLGVVAGIVPWNFPLALFSIKMSMALITGNTMVIKPAPTTPLTALKVGEICARLFPAGVINILADKNDLGQKITAHPGISKISFTGSSATGRKVMESAAASLKRLTLELGGNDPAIVLPDVDVKAVAPLLFATSFLNAGQVCLAIKRIYAHESIYEALCAEMASLAEQAKVGDGLQESTTIGPLQNLMQYNKVAALLERSKQDGKVIAGGTVPEKTGYFIHPTIVRDISDDAPLVAEEQFGPILPILQYSDLDDAIARANASPWGLGASVWSSDTSKARDVASRLDSGTIYINTHVDLDPRFPFGGAKASGIGVEFGEEGLEEYTQVKLIDEVKQTA